MTYTIGCDHTAIELKDIIVKHLQSKNIQVKDHGAFETTRTDYPLYAEKVAHSLQAKEADFGILICGTGIGMSMAANKFKGIRAAAVSEPYSAKLSRNHNDANVLCFGARVVGDELAKMVVDAFIDATYEGGRHQKRVNQIVSFE